MPPVFIPMDRHAAWVRGLWRLLAAALVGGFVAFMVRRIDWEQYWRDQRLVGACLAFVLVIVALPALALAWSGIRWIIAAITTGLGVELNEPKLVVRAGPFGTREFDWKRMSLKVDGDLSPEVWAELPEDSAGVALFHPTVTGDLLDPIRTLLGRRHIEFVRALREQIIASQASS